MTHRWLPPYDDWSARRTRGRHSTKLLCLAPAGDSPAPFARWPSEVHGVELCALRFPGDEEPAWWTRHTTIAAQAVDLAAELIDRAADADSFGLFGHGSAALIVYEVAAHLARCGTATPNRLFVSGCPSPHLARRRTPMPDSDELLERALTACLEWGGNPLPSLLEATERAMRAEALAMRVYEPPGSPWLATPIEAVSWNLAPSADEAAMAGWAAYGPAAAVALQGSQNAYMDAPDELLKLFAHV
ncbi:hypothetical protein KDL01_40780 [Actinospica durhamensis]|uniref:Thioesterase domain-containing protein n=1 Tax=Actinospica durhamensis TaxID=1508375 RepID=A0A941EZN9_9ACTN|nr:thioesterase domain-containing protein [Actinospica durhamensis]MBR7839658.1 hypothetical protein [Actinospica durhamensis]